MSRSGREILHRSLTGKNTNPLRNVIYVDKGLVVLNKPSGLICQTSHARKQPDTAVRATNPSLVVELGMSTPPYPVHRLDKPTTGALILARTPHMARDLSAQFRTRTVSKTYLALVRAGAQTFPASNGEIRTPLDNVDGRVSVAHEGSATGKPAATDWELVASAEKAPISLLRLRLHTGLKHQLRVHLAQVLQAPILGDTIHSTTSPIIDIPCDRLFLHSSHISFFRYRPEGPSRRFRFGVTAPLPKDFADICRVLGISLKKEDITGGIYIDGQQVENGEIPDLQGRWWSPP
ncbi:pseudouridine synthase [Gloeophyllum trabeum ATCC 11539]|uniref:Pseudouridine synthase n=1 Tax=Gloeophyllum trabeum (strain ATCC 11539 / FP-39264 / Madison 617) TaxID=670483 RepID=S7RMI8_GLOTA|nr:pseudouridine synthase [Gloeophyllum trabeum ATCC 11539]EPQ55655.1 pseudouridine synthase [Gloeophyllum trabeum ATCC 11539]